MKTTGSGQIYCSVDLEFTGFDPERDQILEIGFAFFSITEDGVEVTEKWTQVFKPSIEVHPKILGLTGISLKELEDAPEFGEHREFLQEKLGGAIIVGHNPVMDVKFLEAYGIKLSGKVIDTLELVQFILPTHHSYNLENLVHYFGVKHEEGLNTAHRALGDALSTISVLENLIKIYQSFSEELHAELSPIVQKGNFLWAELVNIKLKNTEIQNNDSLKHLTDNSNLTSLKLSDNLITIDETVDNHEARVALGIKENTTNEKTLLVVSDAAKVMQLWKDGLAHGLFKKDDTFSHYNFKTFLQRAESLEELRFCLKIIVWLHTNWQTEVVFDLNISFFGGQFRSFIVGGEQEVNSQHAIQALDYSTLQSYMLSSKQNLLKGNNLVVCDIQNFEKFISAGFQTRLSWSSVLYALRLIYNPETEIGNTALKDEVINALTNTDLFFGLVYMQVHTSFLGKENVAIKDLENTHPHIFTRLKVAAENLKENLMALQKKSKSIELTRIVNFLDGFFVVSPERVKWIDIDERNLSFHDIPIDVSSSVRDIVKGAAKISFTDTITDSGLLSYLVDRLGLNTEVSEIPKYSLPSMLEVKKENTTLSDEELFSEVSKATKPLVVVFPTPSDVKEFYNNHYEEIKQTSSIFAQGYSGGGNKMFRNFSIKDNSVLLVTSEFMAKQNYLLPTTTIMFVGSPNVDTKHPYIEALLNHWENKHENLIELFSYAKILAALKKIKIKNKVFVKLWISNIDKR